MNEIDPLSLAIRALNDMPRTRFRHPVGPYQDTYELVAYLTELKLFSNAMIEAEINGRKKEGSYKGFLYFDPAT